MLADAHVADSAVPIWTASSFWDYSRKTCSNSIAAKHQNVQGVLWLFFSLHDKAFDPIVNLNLQFQKQMQQRLETVLNSKQ